MHASVQSAASTAAARTAREAGWHTRPECPHRRRHIPRAMHHKPDTVPGEISDTGSLSDNAETPDRAPPQALWLVPWDNWRTTQVMVQLWCVAIPVGFGGVQMLAQLRGLPLETLTPADRGVAQAVSACLAELVQLAAAACILERVSSLHQPLPAPWFRYELSARAVLAGVAGGVAALAAVSLVAAVSHEYTPRSESEIKGLLFSGDWVAAGAACTASVVLAPLLEELMYRGFLLASLMRDLPPSLAVVVSSLAFGAAHLSGPDFVPLTALGVVLGCTFLLSEGSLVAATAAHSLYNAVILLSIVADSPSS